LAFAFKDGWREHRQLCDREPDTEGGLASASPAMWPSARHRRPASRQVS